MCDPLFQGLTLTPSSPLIPAFSKHLLSTYDVPSVMLGGSV